MSECAMCGRDLARSGYRTGNPMDGYSVMGSLCKECNRQVMRDRGLEWLADDDARKDLIAKRFWDVILWGIPAFVVILLLIGLLSRL